MRLQGAIGRAQRQFPGRMLSENRATLPAPVKGLNTRDPISDMKRGYATVLDNMFPHDGRVSLRRGFQEYASGVGTGAVQTLFTFRSGDTKKFISAGGGGIYDVTDPSGVTAEKTGLTGNVWDHASSGIVTVMVNGQDTPQLIAADGTFSDAQLTPKQNTDTLDASKLFKALPFKGRIFYLEKDSPRGWYTDAGQATGQLNKYNFSLVHADGGNPIALGNITLDSGKGTDDLLAVFMESGAVLLYSGTNPSEASSWGLAGQYSIGPLVGDRPVLQLGPDLIAITTDGYIPILPFLKTGRVRKELEISDAISALAAEAVKDYRGNGAWQPIYYPAGSQLIVNVPVDGAHEQHVMNTQTGAWCRFTGQHAHCWAVHDEKLYFGGDAGKVYQADVGTADGGENITAVAQTAFNYFRSPNKKTYNMVRALFETRGNPLVRLGAAVDFETPQLLSNPAIQPTGTKWGTAPWGSFQWPERGVRQNEWQLFGVEGTAIAIRMEYGGRGNQVSWFSSDITYERNEGI